MNYVDQIPLYSWEEEGLLEEHNIIHYDWEAIADEFADRVKEVTGIKVDIVIREED